MFIQDVFKTRHLLLVAVAMAALWAALLPYRLAPPFKGRGKFKIFCFGDSLTRGSHVYQGTWLLDPYGRKLQQLLGRENYQVDWLGLGGWQTSRMLKQARDDKIEANGRSLVGLSRRLKGEEPPYDLAIVMAGTNDLNKSNSTAQKIVDNLKKLYRVFVEARVGRILAVGIPESRGILDDPAKRARRRGVNVGLGKLADGDALGAGVLTFVHCPVGVSSGDKYDPPGGVHFNKRSYEALARRLLPTLMKLQTRKN